MNVKIERTASGLVVLSLVSIVSCSSDEKGLVTAEMCDTEPPGGQWDPTAPTEGGVIDWSDPGLQQEPLKSSPWNDIHPHHFSMVAVHAAHLPTSDLLLFHGANEERLWPIGAPASAMTWHPVADPLPVYDPNDPEDVNLCSEEALVTGRCYPSLFCAGHVVLPDGRFFAAGGNRTGRPDGGGLVNTYTFDPTSVSPNVYPFGWTRQADMKVDRWYPTLTVLPDGRVLISSGASREPNGQNRFEVFDPINNTMDELTIGGTAPFTTMSPMPLYPFMFVLPNGDIFYAGAEDAIAAHSHGRVLVPDYSDTPTSNSNWTWSSRTFTSTINGGSAVMYEPGKIMKSGGVQHSNRVIAHATTEIIDLSGYDSNDYAGAPNFYTVPAMDMNEARHFHSLTLLPDGRVLATGGNSRDNGQPGDLLNNSCEYDDVPIASITCSDANNDGIPDDLTATAVANGCPAVPSLCIAGACAFRPGTECNGSLDCGSPCDLDNGNADCPPGSTCGDPSEQCQMPCPGDPNSNCGAAIECSTNTGGACDPANNQCHATRTAEVWDPSCKTWTEFGAELSPRMYHSTAMLLPDGRVISMGGGHRVPLLVEQESAQYFETEYGLAGTAFVPQITVVGETDMPGDAPALPYGGTLQVVLENGSADVWVKDFTLVRLGSVTHQFDMDQRFMTLQFMEDNDSPGKTFTVRAPLSANEAPPGYYMLFLRTQHGEVSTGHYVKLPTPDGTPMSAVYVCPATHTLVATETSCTAEPVSGQCPGGSTQQNTLSLPVVDSPGGMIDGWHILMPAGEIDDPLALSASELANLESRCVAACEAHWESDPAMSANCDDANAFDLPEHFRDGPSGPYDLVPEDQKSGENVFVGQSLTCRLDSTCCVAFDEDLCAAVPDRTTPANDLLGVGEEYRIALGSASEVEIVTNNGTYSSALTGSAGYSFCRDGNASAPCPFYLGSFDALAATDITASATCADNTSARITLTDLVVKLSQPAFGIAEQGTDAKGFPLGGLIFETAFAVGTQYITARRPSGANAIVEANGATFNAEDLVVTFQVPCNSSQASVTARFTAKSPTTSGRSVAHRW